MNRLDSCAWNGRKMWGKKNITSGFTVMAQRGTKCKGRLTGSIIRVRNGGQVGGGDALSDTWIDWRCYSDLAFSSHLPARWLEMPPVGSIDALRSPAGWRTKLVFYLVKMEQFPEKRWTRLSQVVIHTPHLTRVIVTVMALDWYIPVRSYDFMRWSTES